MLDERMVSGAMLGTDGNKQLVGQKKNKKEKKEPKPRKPRELSVQKDINFFDCVKNDRKRNVKKNASKLNLICICGLITIIGVSSAGLWKLNSDMKTNIRVAERYINDPMIKVQMDSINKNKSDVEQIGRFTSSTKVTHETMIARPLLTSSLLEQIIKCMPKTVTFNAVEYDRGIILLTCKSNTDIVAADFVNSLKNVEIDRNGEKVRIFGDTTYETVQRNVETSTTTTVASMPVTNSFVEKNTNLPSNVTAANSNSNNVTVSSLGNNGMVSVLKSTSFDTLVSSTTTNYKYDYTIIISLDNAEVDKNEVK